METDTTEDVQKSRKKQAIEGARMNAFVLDPSDIVVVGIDTEDGPQHPLYDERVFAPLEENMVKNLMVHGVIEPVIVRKNGDCVEVVAGRRRVLHAREANVRLAREGSETIRVPVVLKRGDDATMMGVAISENEVRRDDVPTIKAAKLQRYLATGKTEQEAAVAFGVTVQTIRNWSRMADLDATVLEAVDAGLISSSAASELADLGRSDQRTQLQALLEAAGAGGKVTAKKTKRAVRKAKNDDQGGSEAPGKRAASRLFRSQSLLSSADRTLSNDFLSGVAWMLGLIDPGSVRGLEEALEASSKK